jgi:hypothetical protein
MAPMHLAAAPCALPRAVRAQQRPLRAAPPSHRTPFGSPPPPAAAPRRAAHLARRVAAAAWSREDEPPEEGHAYSPEAMRLVRRTSRSQHHQHARH